MNYVAVSVIMPALNASETITTQLKALAAQDTAMSWEVVVVDNGSTDCTVDVCREWGPRLPALRVLACAEAGTSASRNMGAAAAAADKLLFCDADDEVAPGWLDSMASALECADAVGGAIEDAKLNDLQLPLLRHPDRLPVVAGFLPRAITANLGVRRRVFEDLGGFAEDYEYGGPDTEFCWRLQLASNSLDYVPTAVVHYRHRQTLRSMVVKSHRTGRSRGQLFRDYGKYGMPRPSLVGALLRWVGLVAVLPAIPVSKRARWWWARGVSGATGRLIGSFRYRVLYL